MPIPSQQVYASCEFDDVAAGLSRCIIECNVIDTRSQKKKYNVICEMTFSKQRMLL
jgi:hypothetical protein